MRLGHLCCGCWSCGPGQAVPGCWGQDEGFSSLLSRCFSQMTETLLGYKVVPSRYSAGTLVVVKQGKIIVIFSYSPAHSPALPPV